MWYWYKFTDEYKLCTQGLTGQELMSEISKHGAVTRIIPETLGANVDAPTPPQIIPTLLPPSIKELIEIKIQMKYLREKEIPLKDKIKDLMKKYNIGDLSGDGWTVEYANIATKSFDSKTFALDHPKMWKKYLKSVMRPRLTVKAEELGNFTLDDIHV